MVRVVFTQWDRLPHDQQADADAHAGTGLECDSGGGYENLNYANESAAAAVLRVAHRGLSRTALLSQRIAGWHEFGRAYRS